MKRVWFALLLAAAATGCAPLRIPVSSEVAWARVDTDEIAVPPGEIVRIESDHPIKVTTVIRGAQGSADVTETLAPKDAIVMFRPPLGTAAVRVPHDLVVHIGVAREPEVAWFQIQNDALAWAKTPLGTPFPPLAQAPRFDASDFTAVDSALAGPSDQSVIAIRSLVAIRALHALEGVRMYPYGRNVDVHFQGGGAKREIQNRTFTQLPAGRRATVTIDGPTSISVSARAVRGASDLVADLRVREGTHVRGESRGVIRHTVPLPEDDTVDPTLAPLRHVFVPVPPGEHTYEIEIAGAAGFIAATDTSPYLRIEDWLSGAENQRRLVAEAKAACGGNRPNACALALVLAGEDSGPTFDHAWAAATPGARKIIERLAAGAPSDRAAALESEASTGDGAAMVTLGKDAAATIDPSLREAWWRGTLRGTSWQSVDDGAPPSWATFDDVACGDRAIGAEAVSVPATPWRRTRAVKLLAVAACTPAEPMQIEVNGQTLAAQPSSARALWHVVVSGENARVRRVDHGPGKLYAIADDACTGALIRPALPLASARALAFPAGTSAPGVEVWIKEGATETAMTIASRDGKERLDVVAHPAAGRGALAEDGTRWLRATAIAVPTWALGGVTVTGSANVAVRAVVRGTKSDVPTKDEATAAPANPEAVAAVSRKLLAAKTNDARAAAALERAELLASYGAERAALDDAELAKSWGASPEAVAAVRRAILPAARVVVESSAPPYGLEPDFDPNAARCVPGDGPRAKIAALEATLRAHRGEKFDRATAVQAATLAAAAPQDPRSDSLIALSTGASRWKLMRDVDGDAGRVVRPNEKELNPLVDSEARLRARLYAGDPFGANFVSVSPDRPSRAFVGDIGKAQARLEVVCVPRHAPAAGETCPIDVKLGEVAVPVAARIGDDGHALVELPRARGRGKGADLSVTLAQTRGDWVALIRVVLDAAAPGTTPIAGVGWVLDTPHIQYRFLLQPGHPIRVHAAAPGLVRIDAVPEPGGESEVTASVGGHDVTLPANGEPRVIPIPSANDVVTVTARGGAATIAVAERVEADAKAEAEPEVAASRLDAGSARMSLNDGVWRDVAARSPRPLSWLEDHLGTFESDTGANAGTLRDGSTSNTDLDAYAFEVISYRRRIESLNLFTLVDGLVRVRGDGAPTYGGTLTLYEDLSRQRLRITGTVDTFAQSIGEGTALTIKPRGFIEYSARLTSDFFILPRLGYDGYFSSLSSAPKSSRDVDDDVFNAFRSHRNNFVFLQALFWWVPLFDEIAYIRARGTYDVTNGAFSHASVRPGTLTIIRWFELGAYIDASYFDATAGARATAGIDLSAGATVTIHLPVTQGSFEFRPTASGQVRDDGGWQALAGITIVASARRGVRDYSSLELSFPEATGGGVPWRTDGKYP